METFKFTFELTSIKLPYQYETEKHTFILTPFRPLVVHKVIHQAFNLNENLFQYEILNPNEVPFEFAQRQSM